MAYFPTSTTPAAIQSVIDRTGLMDPMIVGKWVYKSLSSPNECILPPATYDACGNSLRSMLEVDWNASVCFDVS
jgi:hypothetical protein